MSVMRHAAIILCVLSIGVACINHCFVPVLSHLLCMIPTIRDRQCAVLSKELACPACGRVVDQTLLIVLIPFIDFCDFTVCSLLGVWLSHCQ